jgi:hypothetical protein
MYRTASGQETDLAGKIREYTASACWPRDPELSGTEPADNDTALPSVPDNERDQKV